MKHFLRALLLFSLLSTTAFSQTLEDDRKALLALYNAANGVGWLGNNWVVPGNPGDNPCSWSGVACENARVVSLDVSGEYLKGNIPPQIGNLTELKKLNLNARFSATHLTGILPAELGNLVHLEELDIAGHAFGSQNVNVIGNLVDLKKLWFTPLWPIPEEIFTLTKVEELVFSLGGAAPSIVPIGPMPVALTNMTSLQRLTISGTGFTGPLPAEIGKLINLKSFIVGFTLLRGSIPASIGNLTNLTQLGISELTSGGPLPPELGKLTNLKELIFFNNGHTGTIPEEINNLVNATTILFDYSDLTGPLPDLSALQPRVLSVENNNFNFAGIEGNADKFYSYRRQNELPIFDANGQLYVRAGGTLSNNTYKWFKNNVLVQTKVGDSTFTPVGTGTFFATVTNTLVPGLTLTSEVLQDPLPVTLISFTASPQQDQNTLTWRTSSEMQNKGFEIERSSDGRTFKKIAFKEGNGDSKETNSYHFTDPNPFAKTYYRLKQLDYDGTFEYSNIVFVKNANLGVSVYPNPANAQVTVSGVADDRTIVIYNANGTEAAREKLSAAKTVDVSGMPAGIYTLLIGDFVKKLLIQR